MESYGGSLTKQRHIHARVADRACFWQDTDFDRNSLSSNQDMGSFEKDTEIVRNPNEESESQAVHSESDQESDFEIAYYDSNEEKDDQAEWECGFEVMDPCTEIKSKLSDWSTGHNISQRALSELLSRPSGLPKTDRNSLSSNQDMGSFEKDSEMVRNPNEESESQAVHSESDQESDFEIAYYDSNEEKDDQTELECSFEVMDPCSEIKSKLSDWSAGHNISQRALSELLSRPSGLPSASSPSGPQCMCEARFQIILGLLEQNAETLRLQGEMLNRLLKQRGAQKNAPLLEPPVGAVFPLNTNEDVHSMNEKLRDSVLMSGVVAMVGDKGGSSPDDATRRMMAFLLSQELAHQYSLFGHQGKRKFQDLHLFDVVHGALKNNAVTQGVNQKDAERALSRWFTGAHDRSGNTTTRAGRQLGNTLEEGLSGSVARDSNGKAQDTHNSYTGFFFKLFHLFFLFYILLSVMDK